MSAQTRTVRDGIIVGLTGFAAVALFYLAFDFLAARGPLHTVNMLGRAVFRGLREPAVLQFPVELDPRAVLEYSALHLSVAIVVGLFVAWLVDTGERDAARRATIRIIIAAGYLVTVAAVGLVTMPMRELLPWWSILLANALAMLVGGAYLVSRRPGLWSRLALLR